MRGKKGTSEGTNLMPDPTTTLEVVSMSMMTQHCKGEAKWTNSDAKTRIKVASRFILAHGRSQKSLRPNA